MQLTIERSTLAEALEHVCNIVQRRNTIPILSNIMLEASGGRLTLTATDLDTLVQETVDCSVTESGKVTVGASMLRDITKKLPGGSQVQFKLVKGEHRIAVSAGRSRFELSTLPWEDFPVMETASMPCTFTMDASAFRRLIGKVKWSMSTEETRYYLNGFYFHAKDNMLRAVATDGHRLTRYQTDIPDGAADMPGVIVPRRAALELLRLLEGQAGDVEISLSDVKFAVTFGHISFRGKLIDGTFPPYERVIPAGNSNILEANVKDMANIVDRVSVISAGGTRPVKIELTKSGATFTVCNPEAGTSTDDLDAEYIGKPFAIGFNSRYLGDLLSQMETASVRAVMGDAGEAAIFEPVGDASALYVLMPLRF